MTGSGLRQGLKDLACNVMRVLFVYALVLQTLAPLAVARAEARDGLDGYPVLCSAMADTGAERHGKLPPPVVHDCLACCLGSAVGILTMPVAWPEPASRPLPVVSLELKVPVLPDRAGSPPPQRAPPSLV